MKYALLDIAKGLYIAPAGLGVFGYVETIEEAEQGTRADLDELVCDIDRRRPALADVLVYVKVEPSGCDIKSGALLRN